MMAAALLGYVAGITPEADAARILALTRRLGALPPWPKVAPAKLIAAMRADKKARAGKIRFVLSPRIGQARSYDGISAEILQRVLQLGPALLAHLGAASAL
jgi:3-dehydroquinate synthase